MSNQSFSRKGNAERHNERVHDGLATIYDTRNRASTIVRLNSKNPVYKNKFKQMQLISELVSKKDEDNELYSTFLSFGDHDDKLKIMRIFGQLKQPFEELESLLNEFDESSKTNIICQIIISCLKSSRPIKSLKETIELYKSLKCMNKISQYFSKDNNLSKEEAKIMLEQLVKNSIYFNNNIN